MSALLFGLGVAAFALKGSSRATGPGVIADLSKLHPSTAAKVRKVLAFMNARGTPFLVNETLRTAARQAELYAQGRTKLVDAKGNKLPIVTHKTGNRGDESNHQAKKDGLGRAADLIIDHKHWRLSSPAPTWGYDLGVEGDVVVRPDVLAAWHAMGNYATSIGLRWLGGPAGGELNRVTRLAFDPPHVEDLTV